MYMMCMPMYPDCLIKTACTALFLTCVRAKPIAVLVCKLYSVMPSSAGALDYRLKIALLLGAQAAETACAQRHVALSCEGHESGLLDKACMASKSLVSLEK